MRCRQNAGLPVQITIRDIPEALSLPLAILDARLACAKFVRCRFLMP